MSSWTLSKIKIPITIIKAQMPSNPNQKSRMRDNNSREYRYLITRYSRPSVLEIVLPLSFLNYSKQNKYT